MRTVISALSLDLVNWQADWAWGVPLVVLTVILHVLTLGLIDEWGVRVFSRHAERRAPLLEFVSIMSATAVYATALHALEASIWAASYEFLGALPDFKSAMLYSINAITSYGHENLLLKSHWQLLGPIEALNGCLLFGLTTAFLFGMIQKVWSLRRNEESAKA